MPQNPWQQMPLPNRVQRTVLTVLRPIRLTRAVQQRTATLPWVRPSARVAGTVPDYTCTTVCCCNGCQCGCDRSDWQALVTTGVGHNSPTNDRHSDVVLQRMRQLSGGTSTSTLMRQRGRTAARRQYHRLRSRPPPALASRGPVGPLLRRPRRRGRPPRSVSWRSRL